MKGMNRKEIREREQKASVGPWKAQRVTEALIEPHVMQIESDGHQYTIATPVHSNPQTMRNMEFIAHARQDIPDLLDALEKLEVMVEKASRLLEEAPAPLTPWKPRVLANKIKSFLARSKKE